MSTTDSEAQERRSRLERQHEQYDPEARMLKVPFSSPGYHTTLKGGTVHPTREALSYAVSCLETDDPALHERAADILETVIALQDTNPENRTWGIWSWFLEEPLTVMSPPDWNWADFCGEQLLQVKLFHSEKIPGDVMRKVDASVVLAARSVEKRNVGPGYTNIAVLGSYVTLVTAEAYGLDDLKEYAIGRLKRLDEHTVRQGAFTEYNSPTYTIVTLNALGRLRRDAKDTEAQAITERLYRAAWQEIADHYHVPTGQWAGPHSRAYSNLVNRRQTAVIETGLSLPSDAKVGNRPWETLLPCPADLHRYFTTLDAPRMLVKTFVKDEPPVIGTTHLTLAFTLGSINRSEMWNQRRPLLAYWGDRERPSYARLRFLHDGYDFSTVQFWSAQEEGRVLVGLCLATDGGDTHVGLDRLKEARFTAKDLRLRVEFGGAAAEAPLKVDPEARSWGGRFDTPGSSAKPVEVSVAVLDASLDGAPGRAEAGREGETGRVDWVFYQGEAKTFDLSKMREAFVTLAFGISTERPRVEEATARREKETNQISITWGGLALATPSRPETAKSLQAQAWEARKK